ncbi:hypothetical protein FBEOM_9386 [Fusarium beomiforme]|uniref:Uncharacterized protein n=1 Tax=Fusarium beomiforme TaxID=44412 RepID=A0A9P5ADI2_9HYPO|nr:hypothetical protein FBEOM_9386 [Fusarium beomiforme]
MSQLLAPYNDSMRLGMAYNSYTQTMYIDSAAEATEENTITLGYQLDAFRESREPYGRFEGLCHVLSD